MLRSLMRMKCVRNPEALPPVAEHSHHVKKKSPVEQPNPTPTQRDFFFEMVMAAVILGKLLVRIYNNTNKQRVR